VARIEVRDDQIDIRLSLAEEVLALHGTLHIPLRHVMGVSAEPVPPAAWRGMRIGTNVPGVVVAGTFFTAEGAVFYDMRHGDRCVTIELAGERYKRVVVEVDPGQDPQVVASEIEAKRQAQ